MSLNTSTEALTRRLNEHAEHLRRERQSVPPPAPLPPLTEERILEMKRRVLANHMLLSLLALDDISPHEIGRMFDAARGKR